MLYQIDLHLPYHDFARPSWSWSDPRITVCAYPPCNASFRPSSHALALAASGFLHNCYERAMPRGAWALARCNKLGVAGTLMLLGRGWRVSRASTAALMSTRSHTSRGIRLPDATRSQSRGMWMRHFSWSSGWRKHVKLKKRRRNQEAASIARVGVGLCFISSEIEQQQPARNCGGLVGRCPVGRFLFFMDLCPSCWAKRLCASH